MPIPPIYSLVLLCTLAFGSLAAQEKEKPFIENKGQWDPAILAKVEQGEASLFLEQNAFHYQFIHVPHQHASELHDHSDSLVLGHNFRAEFVGANSKSLVSLNEPGQDYRNYYVGKNEERWKSEVHSYHKIQYQGLYSGIDLKAYGHQGGIKYDYIIAPEADVNQIQIRYRGVEKPLIRNGELHIEHALGRLIEEKPFAFQMIQGEKREVSCHYYFLDNGNIGFEFPKGYDTLKELIIDPVLIFSTYSGSTGSNFGMTATYDNQSNGYMGGVNFSSGYDTTLGAFQRVFNGGHSDIVISKFNPDGSQLLFATYLGGDSCETVHSMVVDEQDNLVVFGVSNSLDFPVLANAYDTTKDSSRTVNLSHISAFFPGGTDIIISKFNPGGTALLGSTFFGGDETDGLNVDFANANSSNLNLLYNYGDHFRGEVITDSIGNVYIGTSTYTKNLSTGTDTLGGNQDGIVAKFSPDLSSLIWSRYVGGSENDGIYSLKIINGDRVLVGGGTKSFNDFPATAGSYSDTAFGGQADGFISIISSDGQSIEKSTFIGNAFYNQVYFIEFDRFGGIYAFGQTQGSFPLKNTRVADSLAGQFIVKLDNNLDSLIYSTTFGDGQLTGAINISPTAFLVDQCQNVYVSGWGASIRPLPSEGQKFLTNNMPITADAFRSTTSNLDFYLYVMRRDADSVLYASFFGGTSSRDHVDGGTSRFDKRGVIYQSVCASCSVGSDFPTTPNSHAPVKRPGTGINCNNALFKFDFEILPRANIITDKQVVCAPSFVTIVDSSKNAEELLWDFFGTSSRTQDLDTTIYFDTPGFYTIRQYARDTICNTIDSTEIIIEVQPSTISYTPTNDVNTCDQSQVDLTALHFGTASEIHWSSSPQFTDTLNLPGDSSIVVLPISIPRNYYLRLGNPGSLCEVLDTVTVLYIPLSANSFLDEDTICEGTDVQFLSSFLNASQFLWDFGDSTLDSTNLNPIKSYSNPGDYTIQVVVSNDLCLDQDTNELFLNVRLNPLQIASTADTTYCGLDTLLFQINSFGTADDFLWSSNSNFSDTLNQFPNDSLLNIFSNTNQNYYKKITDRYCERTSVVNVHYIRYRAELLALPDSLCAPANVQINTLQEGINSFQIDFGNGQFTNSNPNPVVNYSDSGNYIIQFASSNNLCPRADTSRDTIRIEPQVLVASLFDTTVCLGDTALLIGSGLGTAQKFYWSDAADFSNILNALSDSTLKVSPAAPGLAYYFKTERSICADSTSVQVNVEEVDVFLDDVSAICLDDSVSIQAINNGANPLNYLWQPNDSVLQGQNTAQILVSPKQDLVFYLRSSSAIGCLDSDSILIQVSQPAFDDAEIITSSDSIYSGQRIQLSTNRNGPNLSYQWSPATGLSDPTAAMPIAAPSQSTLYRVSIFDENTGCVVSSFRLISVYEINCGEPDIFIPTAFTPNGDGANDKLFVRGSNLNSIDLQVFNRWGELVYQSTNIQEGWDGTFKGKEADPGVFVYQLKATCFDGQSYSKKGNITLIR